MGYSFMKPIFVVLSVGMLACGLCSAPEWSFPGLKPGDKWCLCALRWREARKAGVAPKLDLKATHSKMLKYVPLKELGE